MNSFEANRRGSDIDLRGGKAVIYARVSSSKQTKVGDGLGSQQTRCREYARYKGLSVVETFTDDMSGSLATRPGMKAMLAFLRKHRGKEPVTVIIDDLSRLARGTCGCTLHLARRHSAKREASWKVAVHRVP
jgi:DNA invertase Pin-like site-specific DNA recombinase